MEIKDVKTMANNAYKYLVSMQYQGGSQDGEILQEHIRSVIIDHNYDLNCMPVIYANIEVDRKMLDDMILKQNDAYMILKIQAFNSTSSFASSTDSINCKCMYFVDEEISKLDPENFGSQKENSEMMGQSYSPVSIGMICIDHINNNKKNFSMVQNEANMQAIVHDVLDHFQNLIMEPLEYNDVFQHLIIPSNVSDTVNKTLQYLNNMRVFYSTPYRYYQDFNNTYLISSSGKGYAGSSSSSSGSSGSSFSLGSLFGGGGSGNSITINVTDADDMSSAISGIITTILTSILGLGGTSSGGTQVSVNYSMVEVQDNTVSNKSRNKIRIVQSDSTDDNELSSKSDLTQDTIHSVRLNNDNEHMIENITALNNSQNYLVSFVKTDLDSSIFTINKEIKINNIQRYQELNGTYLLFRKREIYIRQDDTFLLMTSISLRRIDSSNDSSNQSGSSSYYSL